MFSYSSQIWILNVFHCGFDWKDMHNNFLYMSWESKISQKYLRWLYRHINKHPRKPYYLSSRVCQSCSISLTQYIMWCTSVCIYTYVPAQDNAPTRGNKSRTLKQNFTGTVQQAYRVEFYFCYIWFVDPKQYYVKLAQLYCLYPLVIKNSLAQWVWGGGHRWSRHCHMIIYIN